MKVWRETEFTSHYYYDEGDGKIIGQVHKLGTQNIIYLAKVYDENIERTLGQYIDAVYAKNAVENFWLMVSRTLTHSK